ncbi:MAG: hypothetical protein LBU27_09495 [Candidatus Peribacteria bacterium]|jgi:hypothetical protein|nr:hypothetical protein [Candidatus Peribacteria bacterium]
MNNDRKFRSLSGKLTILLEAGFPILLAAQVLGFSRATANNYVKKLSAEGIRFPRLYKSKQELFREIFPYYARRRVKYWNGLPSDEEQKEFLQTKEGLLWYAFHSLFSTQLEIADYMMDEMQTIWEKLHSPMHISSEKFTPYWKFLQELFGESVVRYQAESDLKLRFFTQLADDPTFLSLVGGSLDISVAFRDFLLQQPRSSLVTLSVNEEAVIETVNQYLSCLKREDIVRKFYGLSELSMDLSALGEKYALTRARILQILSQAKKKLRNGALYDALLAHFNAQHVIVDYERKISNLEEITRKMNNDRDELVKEVSVLKRKKQVKKESKQPLAVCDDSDVFSFLVSKIEDASLSVRTRNCLYSAEIKYFFEIFLWGEISSERKDVKNTELLKRIRNMGEVSVKELEKFFSSYGISLDECMDPVLLDRCRRYLEGKLL